MGLKASQSEKRWQREDTRRALHVANWVRIVQKVQRCGMVGEVMSVESGFGQWGKTSFLIVREDSMELRYQESQPKLL